ncbi:hypothetical protein B0H19DRAFT_1162441 [Mycena capillaripes]|nr:hypothetical protein B0H19DRAFT_1204519 [Mycena capillaripes]KAJ6548975.1 hypothetical protein B0H19DRAFT_1162441 [Mycena capillaripes]
MCVLLTVVVRPGRARMPITHLSATSPRLVERSWERVLQARGDAQVGCAVRPSASSAALLRA